MQPRIMSMRAVPLGTRDFSFVIQEMILRDHAFWKKHGEVILDAWKANDSCLYGFLATQPEKTVPCLTLINKENKSVVELLWVSPHIRRGSVATLMIKQLEIAYILSPHKEEDPCVATFCSYFPHIKRISSLAQCNAVIDLCDEERCSNCQSISHDISLCAGFVCSPKSRICASDACSNRCFSCDQLLCNTCFPFCECEPAYTPVIDPLSLSEKEALGLDADDVVVAPLPTSQAMIDEKLAMLKNRRGVVLTQSGNTSSGTINPGDPISIEAVERARVHLNRVFARSSTFNEIRSYGLKSYLEGWRRKHITYQSNKDYYISHGDFIVAMILEGYCFKFREDYSALAGPSIFSCQFNCILRADKKREEEEEEEESESQHSEYVDYDSDCMIVEKSG